MALFRTAIKIIYLALVTALILTILLKIKQTAQDQKKYDSLPDYDELHEFDPEREGGHLLPNLNGLFKSDRSSKAIRWITNSKGFRNEKEFPYTPDERTFRILFLGDSYVDGLRTDQTKTIGYLLEKELNEKMFSDKFDRYEVMISGHNNPVNAWYYYQRHGYKYKPDLVLLGVTISNDLTWNSYRVTFVPVKDARGRPRLEKTGRTINGRQPEEGLIIPEDGYVKKSSLDIFLDIERVARMLLSKWSAPFSHEAPPTLKPPLNSPRHIYATKVGIPLGLFYIPIMPEVETIYSDLEETLTGFKDAVDETGSRLAVVLFPVSIQLHEKEWDLLKRLYFLDEKKFDLDYPDKRLFRLCQKNNIPCMDVLPAFKEISQKNRGTRLYRLRGDMHFNEKGQEITAAALYKFIRSTLEIGIFEKGEP